MTRTTSAIGRPAGWLGRHPSVAIALGALSVSASSILIDLSATSPGTASFYRCLLALPALIVLAAMERRRDGGPPLRRYGLAFVVGAMFAGDILLWTQAIYEVGAGISTVLVNVQVVLVPMLAWAVDREPVTRRFLLWLPVLVLGVVLTSGIVDGGAVGPDPLWGSVHALLAAVFYSLYLFLLRRGGHGGHVMQTYAVVILSAGLVSLAAGALWYGIDLAPGWSAIGWLIGVAACSQVVGWLLVAVYSPAVPSHVGGVLLLLTPAGAVVLGGVVLAERPTPLQLAGSVLVLAGAYFAVSYRSSPEAERIVQ